MLWESLFFLASAWLADCRTCRILCQFYLEQVASLIREALFFQMNDEISFTSAGRLPIVVFQQDCGYFADKLPAEVSGQFDVQISESL